MRTAAMNLYSIAQVKRSCLDAKRDFQCKGLVSAKKAEAQNGLKEHPRNVLKHKRQRQQLSKAIRKAGKHGGQGCMKGIRSMPVVVMPRSMNQPRECRAVQVRTPFLDSQLKLFFFSFFFFFCRTAGNQPYIK